MAVFNVSGIAHMRVTVSDLRRSIAFYTEVLGFEVMLDGPPPVGDPDYDITVFNLQGGAILRRGDLVFGLRPSPDGAVAPFDENRAGLDHVSFWVDGVDDLRAAVAEFDAHGISHGEVKDLGGAGIYVLGFRDPDNIQLELAAKK